MTKRAALAAAIAAGLPTVAEAHLNSTGMGPLYDGVAHFATSPGDLLSALAVALLAGLRGAEHGRRAMFALPSAWLVGSLAGSGAPAVRDDALVSAVWLLALGGLLALDAKLSARGVTALAACVGLAHGFLNGAGLGWSASSLGALVGLAAAVFALSALASGLAVAIRADWPRIALRVAGSWIAASGLLWLGWALRSSG
ncbi:MAG: HupE/UreJ family protein [Myxococcota bacterium]